VAIYARVSSEEQREGQTIDSQIAELERFVREKGWVLIGVYKDEGWSGALLSRPALDCLRDEAVQKKFDFVLLNDVDRLARDVAHLGIVKRDLERSGVRVIFRKLPQEESPTYNLMVNVLGSFAEFEREMIADRTRRGRRHKVEVRQQFLGSLASYGYRYVPKDKSSGKDGYLEVMVEEAALVQQMYEWVDREALSAHQVVERLNQLQSRPRKGGRWAKSTVLRVLRNETYAGVWHYNKHYGSESLKPTARTKYRRSLKNSSRLRPREEWLPVILPEDLRIVSRDLWQRVQQQLTKNVTFSRRNAKHEYLLKGLVRCGGCGAAYVGDPCHGKYYYRCLRRCKRMPTVKEKCLDEAVWSAVSEAVLNPTTILSQVGKLREQEAENGRTSWQAAQTVERALAQARREEARLFEAYRTGIISPAQLGEELERLKQRQNTLEMRSATLRKPTEGPGNNNLCRSVEEYCQAVAERLQTFNEIERPRFLRLLIDKVIFEGERVRIRAVIPLNETALAGNAVAKQMSELRVASDVKNATMNIDPYNRNSVEKKDRTEDTFINLRGHNSVRGDYSIKRIFNGERFIDCVNFELFKTLPEKPFSILSDEGLELLRLLKLKAGDPTLQELCDKVREERGAEVSLSHMSRALRRLKLSPMRRGPRAKELKRGLNNISML
jgi:site-specific DNA recombinase